MRFAQKYKISTNRLANWDYSTPADYFINICTYNHNNFFGKIIDNKMELSPRGIIAQNCLINIPRHFSDVCLDAYVVMPDLASLQDNRQIKMVTHDHLNHPDFYSTINQKSKQLIPNIVQQYKSTVTRLINPKIIFFA